MILTDSTELPLAGSHYVRGFDEEDAVFVFEEGFALELFRALHYDGWRHWPVELYCEHCGSWVTSLKGFDDAGEANGFFCHCLGLWTKDDKVPTQRKWYGFRSRALKLWQEQQPGQAEEEELWGKTE
jgi:hypothetical protein